tara:strand:- start:463 stop:909 length:447 start_codon:yes stop_codon:yes gene_type:complete
MQKIFLIILFLICYCSQSYSKEIYYLMLKNNTVNVRYGPSFEYPIKYIYKKKFLPLQVIDKKENFRKVIDHLKNSGWIHISQLKKSQSVVIIEEQILFSKPSKYSKPIAKMEKGRLLVLKKCKKNWCKIKSANYSGWIEISNVWGKIN